jgi:hypothetical protein
MGFWDCLNCGAQGILGLPNCPQCHAPNPEEVPAEAPATSDTESGTQADASAGATTESQAQDTKSKKGGGNAKGE